MDPDYACADAAPDVHFPTSPDYGGHCTDADSSDSEPPRPRRRRIALDSDSESDAAHPPAQPMRPRRLRRAKEATPPSDEDAPQPKRPRDRQEDLRRWNYQLIWPHPTEDDDEHKKPGDFSRLDLAMVVVTVYRACSVPPPKNWLVAREKHEDGEIHMHMMLNGSTQHRCRGLAQELRKRGLYVRFEPLNSYFAGCRYITEASLDKDTHELDATPLYSPSHPPVPGMRRLTDAVVEPPESDDEEPVSQPTLTKRFNLTDAYELVTTYNIRKEADFTAKAHDDRRLVHFAMHYRGQLAGIIDQAWAIADAASVVAEEKLSRMDKVRRAAYAVGGCVCGGRYEGAADEVLALQGITPQSYCSAVVAALERGRRKETNIYVWGGLPNCGKTFLVQPLALIFKETCFENPEAGAFPFTDLPGSDIVIWQDWRYTPGILKWERMLQWWEGKIAIRLAMPKNKNAHDFRYTEDAPVFMTSKALPHHSDASETSMALARIRPFHFHTPMQRIDLSIVECGKCFANYLLKHGTRRRRQ